MSDGRFHRTLGTARILAAFLALHFLAPGGVESAEASGSFRVKGKAGPLFPGVSGDLVLTIRNPFDHPILVTAVRVEVGKASRRCRAGNLRTPGFMSDVRVSALSNAKVTVPIRLRADAPDPCQGKSFPLRFSGRATRP
jgi:hypothetical protein